MKILSMDIESCTGGNRDGSMCSFGYTLCSEDFDILHSQDILINPAPKRFVLGKWGEEPRIKLAYPERVFRASPRFNEVYEQVKSLFEPDTLVIGYAVVNDVKYLNNACETYGLKPIEYRFIDVQLIYRLYKGLKEGCGLATCATDFGIEFTAHRSDEDAKVTMLVLKGICDRLGMTLTEMLAYYGIRPGIVRAGEYVGCTADSLDLERFSKKRRKNRELLINEYIYSLRHVRGRGVMYHRWVYIDHQLLYSDADKMRAIVGGIIYQGGRIAKSRRHADIVVADVKKHSIMIDNDGYRNDRGEIIDYMTLDELVARLDNLPKIDVSQDDDIIRNYYQDKDYKMMFGE